MKPIAAKTMTSLLACTLTAVVAWTMICLCSETSKDLFTRGGVDVPSDPEEIEFALRQTEVPPNNEMVFALISALNGDYELERFEAKDYVDLNFLNVKKCFPEDYERYENLCSKTKIASLKGYCDYCKEQFVEFCYPHRDFVLKKLTTIIRTEDNGGKIPPWCWLDDVRRLTSNAEYFRSEFGRFIKRRRLDAADFEKNVFLKCRDYDSLKYNRVFEDCELLVKLVDKDLAYLGYNTEFMVQLVNSLQYTNIEKRLEFCRVVKSKCAGIKLISADEEEEKKEELDTGSTSTGSNGPETN